VFGHPSPPAWTPPSNPNRPASRPDLRGVPVIPKSVHRKRFAENALIFDFSLSDEDMAELDALNTGGTGQAQERRWWS
jgi:hypothetical protein